jgi:hypothetical protein
VGTCISLAALLGLLLNGMVIYAFPRWVYTRERL